MCTVEILQNGKWELVGTYTWAMGEKMHDDYIAAGISCRLTSA